MTIPDGPVVLAASRRGPLVAARLEPQSGQAVLRSITEAAVTLFGAEAASIALHEPRPTSSSSGSRRAAGRARSGSRSARARASRVRVHDRPAARGDRRDCRPAVRPLAARRPGTSPADPRGPVQTTAAPSACSRSSTGRVRRSLRDLDLAAVFARQAAYDQGRPGRAGVGRAPAGDARAARRGPDRRCRRDRGGGRGGRRQAGRRGRRAVGLADAVARARAAAPDELGLVERDPRGARAPRPRPPSVPPVTAGPPAWSEPFAEGHRRARARQSLGPDGPGWAFGDASGRGLRVAIIDSAWSAPIRRSAAVSSRASRPSVTAMTGTSSPPRPMDVVGHGTACAGIVHALAPEADIVSVRVLGPDNRGNGGAFATGLCGRSSSPVRPSPTSRSRRAATRSSACSTSSPTRPTSGTSCSWPPRTTCPWPATRRSTRRWCRSRRTTCRARTPGSTTPPHRSSSADTGSTWTSPGGAARGWS